MKIESKLIFLKQKTAYEMRISDWSSDVCSSDLRRRGFRGRLRCRRLALAAGGRLAAGAGLGGAGLLQHVLGQHHVLGQDAGGLGDGDARLGLVVVGTGQQQFRSEEHTSELQSLMRISYAVFCLKKKINNDCDMHTQETI